MTNEEAEKLLKELTMHYGCRVAPVNVYCRAFEEWYKALSENGDPGAAIVGQTIGMVYKSNLLSRLVYAGEKLRTRKCPVHKGTWSGCHWGDESLPNRGLCDCQRNERGEWDSNVCGWLADQDDEEKHDEECDTVSSLSATQVLVGANPTHVSKR